VWKPVWKPRLAWDGKSVRYFLSFGARNLTNNVLDGALDNIDNLWTGYYLGDLSLGYYSRAFRFAIYPRIMLTQPINAVAMGTLAELKFDRLRLSKAFFRVSVYLTRLGFLFAGLLSVIAPQFIVLFLGAKWLPMLAAFRLLLVYSLLDPMRVITASVLIAVGKPEKVSQVRMVQLLILATGLFTLGFSYQIAGVALSMDLMVLVGVLLSLRLLRDYVDFSMLRLFAPPALALFAGISLNTLVSSVWDNSGSPWLALIVKSLAFCTGYLLLLFALEGKTLYKSFTQFVDLPGMIRQAREYFDR
jgi:O-antigen/teichoic acid export membrane protein